MSTLPSNPGASIVSCPCCGLVQTMPHVPRGMRARCGRCHGSLGRPPSRLRSNQRTAAIALAALILYPIAVTLPMLKIEQFGYHNESGILEGVTQLFASGHLVVGLVVLACSVILPLGKLAALFVLSAGGLGLPHRHRAFTYRLVEFTGRWGMLDVLLVAVLVATLKLGDMVAVTAGPAALAFTSCVVLSLLATASFDPHSLWRSAA